ncbi:MAG: hypothetical protein CVT48_01245 [Thermoplasmata archaeon HGW-Thermoplasmata-1]|nr:MAG: hypothetical protein CVT48_01245 [Thermoplasmata archaeon HGW-Thermoplasmata-1]
MVKRYSVGQLVLGSIYVLLGLGVFIATLIIYYEDVNLPGIGSTGSGWALDNHELWWVYLLVWVLSALIVMLGAFLTFYAYRSAGQRGKSQKKPAASNEYWGAPVPAKSSFETSGDDEPKLKIKCRKCDESFDIREAEKEEEFYCPGCGRPGRINE